jgi:hypothetical protein
MQQKRKGTRKSKQTREQQSPAKPREKATRAKTTLGTRLKSFQEHISTKPAPQHGQRQASYVKETASSSSLEFRACALVGPDGQSRPGWELWVGGMMFGRADTKETLLAYHARLHDPLPSGHWKDRAWQPMKKKPTSRQTNEEQDPRFDDDDADTESEADNSWNE